MRFASSKRRKHSKPGKTTLRAYHFRIEASRQESAQLHRALDLAWELRNEQVKLLEENRREAREQKQRGETSQYLGAFDLKKKVASGTLHPKFAALHSQVRQDLSLRVSEGQKRWLDALKEGRSGVRPPRLTARKYFRSITYTNTELQLGSPTVGCTSPNWGSCG